MKITLCKKIQLRWNWPNSLKNHKLPSFTQDEIDNMNSPIILMGFIIKSLWEKNNLQT